MCREYTVLWINRQRKALLEETHQEKDRATATHTDSAALPVSVKSDQNCHLPTHTYSAANTTDLLDSTVVRQCTHRHWKHRGCTLAWEETRKLEVLPVPVRAAAGLHHQPTLLWSPTKRVTTESLSTLYFPRITPHVDKTSYRAQWQTAQRYQERR